MKIQTSLCFILLHSAGAHEVPVPFSALTILQAPSTHPSDKAAALLTLLVTANIPLVMEVPTRKQCYGKIWVVQKSIAELFIDYDEAGFHVANQILTFQLIAVLFISIQELKRFIQWHILILIYL